MKAARAAELRTSLGENKKKRHLRNGESVIMMAIAGGNVGNKRFTTKTETIIGLTIVFDSKIVNEVRPVEMI